MRKGTRIMICISLALLALGITLYPLISNYFAEVNRSMIETRYTKAVELMDDSEIVDARMEAQRYNATLLTVTDKPYTKEALHQASESYEGLLNIQGNGIMGYLVIPKLGIELPIYHGTDEEVLDRGLGHLLGSSLPVGGTGTHCVITGHSGLAGQRMFSDLDQLQLLDVFYIKTLDETLAYSVIEINTVLPEDTSKLTINPQGDNVTLVTCTPYGVNTHRLLVRGTRTSYERATQMEEANDFEEITSASTWDEEYRRGVRFGMIGIVLLASLIGTVNTMIHQRRARAQARPAAKHMGEPASRHRGHEVRRKHEAP